MHEYLHVQQFSWVVPRDPRYNYRETGREGKGKEKRATGEERREGEVGMGRNIIGSPKMYHVAPSVPIYMLCP